MGTQSSILWPTDPSGEVQLSSSTAALTPSLELPMPFSDEEILHSDGKIETFEFIFYFALLVLFFKFDI